MAIGTGGIIGIVFGVLIAILDIITIIHILGNTRLGALEKFIAIILVLALPILFPLIYFIFI